MEYIRRNFKIVKPSWRYVWFNKHYQATYQVYMNWFYWHKIWLLGKDSSNFVSAMHKISIFPSTILSKSPDLFLIELIFRYEKITLLRWECCNRFKATLTFSSYSWLELEASIRGSIYLLNMLITRTLVSFTKHLKYFLQKHHFSQIATK